MIYFIWGDVDGMAELLRVRGDEFAAVADVKRFGSEGVMAFQQDVSRAITGSKHVVVAASLDNLEAIRGITHKYTVLIPSAKTMDAAMVEKGYLSMGRAMRARRRVSDFGVLREYAETVGTNIVMLTADMTLVEYFAATVPVCKPPQVLHVAKVRAAMEKAVLEAMDHDVLTWGMRTDPSASTPDGTEWRSMECRVPTNVTHDMAVLMLKDAVANAFPQEVRDSHTVVLPGEWTATLVNNTCEHFHCRRMIEIAAN